MIKLTKFQCFRILIVYSLLALAAFFCYNAKQLLLPARKRPFQCSDRSLAKPFVQDTVPPTQLNLLGIYFPIVLITICEFSSLWSVKKLPRSVPQLSKCLLRTVILVTLFLIGLAVERLYKTVAKIKMARLRPNFITVCQPVTALGEKCFSLTTREVMYEYECSSKDYPSWAVRTAFASFPSGHTSLTAYGMTFFICYLYLSAFKQKRLQSCSTLVILIVQVLCFFIILFVAISRVLDFRHHWSDVCAGFIGGSCIALAVNYYLLSQLETMEKWLTQVARTPATDADTVETGCANKTVNDNEGKCGMEELVTE